MKRKEKKVVSLKDIGIIVTKRRRWENSVILDVTSQYNEHSPYNKPLK
jgi:hypothetical protein